MPPRPATLTSIVPPARNFASGAPTPLRVSTMRLGEVVVSHEVTGSQPTTSTTSPTLLEGRSLIRPSAPTRVSTSLLE